MSSYLSPVIRHNDNNIFVNGSKQEKEFDFLLDTGAEFTVIPTKLAEGLNNDPALQASSGMVLGQTVNVRCPHAVSALMNQAKVTSVTSSRWGNWLTTLTAPNIDLQRAPVPNPSSCMMSAMTEVLLEDEGEMTHDCVTLTYAATSEIAETPIENAELELFVDGSIIDNPTKAVQSARESVESCWQMPPEGGHTIIQDQWVMIKSFRNKPLEPKWQVPHQVMLITAAAVLCQGRKALTHVSHCKVVPPPTGIG